ncbi:hypothetical protein IWQ62_006378, partial [Dispira parvispora]
QQQDQGGENSGVENSPSASNPTDIQPSNSQGNPEQPPDVTHTSTSGVHAPATPTAEPSTNSTGYYKGENTFDGSIWEQFNLCKLLVEDIFATVKKQPEIAPLSSPGNEANQVSIFQWLNQYREANDLHPLRFDPRLEKVTLEFLPDIAAMPNVTYDTLKGEVRERLLKAEIGFLAHDIYMQVGKTTERALMVVFVDDPRSDGTLLFPCYTHAALATVGDKMFLTFATLV